VRLVSIIGFVGLAMAAGLAGTLAGFGLFILSMIAMNYWMVVGSSVLFSFSLAVLIAGYIWLTQ